MKSIENMIFRSANPRPPKPGSAHDSEKRILPLELAIGIRSYNLNLRVMNPDNNKINQ